MPEEKKKVRLSAVNKAAAELPRPKVKKIPKKIRGETTGPLKDRFRNALKTYPQRTQNPDKPLTDMQKKFVKFYVEHGLNQTQAAAQAGFRHPGTVGSALMTTPNVRRAIQIEQERYAKASQMTRKKVLDGFLEAIEIGKLKGESIAMTAGWREIAKMCGFYAPTKHQVSVSVNGQVMMSKLQQLTDDELLQLAEEAAPEPIEGEFKELGHSESEQELGFEGDEPISNRIFGETDQ